MSVCPRCGFYVVASLLSLRSCCFHMFASDGCELLWKPQLGSENKEVTTRKRQRGSNNLRATTWEWQLGRNNVEATMWKKGVNWTENIKIQNCDSTPSKTTNALTKWESYNTGPPLGLMQQLGSNKVEAAAWKRQHVNLIGFRSFQLRILDVTQVFVFKKKWPLC